MVPAIKWGETTRPTTFWDRCVDRFWQIVGTNRYEWLYWLKCHLLPHYRFHQIDARDKRNGWPYGWRDSDARMFFACWAIFIEFVEKELPVCWIDWDHEEMQSTKKTITELYAWWKHDRVAEQEAIGADFDRASPGPKGRYKGPAWDKYLADMEAWEQKDEAMFMKLLEIRHHLWT